MYIKDHNYPSRQRSHTESDRYNPKVKNQGKSKRSCTVIAETVCELKSLDRGDAAEIFTHYPYIYKELKRHASERTKNTNYKKQRKPSPTKSSTMNAFKCDDNIPRKSNEELKIIQLSETEDARSEREENSNIEITKEEVTEISRKGKRKDTNLRIGWYIFILF